MNLMFITGGLLALLASPIHLWGGENHLKYIPPSLFPPNAQGDGQIARQEVRMVWHMATWDLWLGGAILLLLGLGDWLGAEVALGRVVAAYFGGYAVLILLLPALALRQASSPLRLPQWILCGLIALLALGGTL
jgi:hypothetical protein